MITSIKGDEKMRPPKRPLLLRAGLHNAQITGETLKLSVGSYGVSSFVCTRAFVDLRVSPALIIIFVTVRLRAPIISCKRGCVSAAPPTPRSCTLSSASLSSVPVAPALRHGGLQGRLARCSS
jgi:hypothetical protein